MKFWNRFWFVVAVMFVCASVWPGYAQDTTATEEEAPALPESVDMSLGVVNSEYVMPEGFRGKDAEEGDLQWLEDVGYLMAENSDLYNVDANAIAESAQFEGPPNINWEVKKEDESGNLNTESSEDTNVASNPCNITDPGYYQVHNGGARQVSSAGGAEGDAVGGTDEEAGGSATATTGAEGEEGGEASGAASTVTAQQRVGIEVHDCTSPDVWIAFQEGAGNINMAESEEALKAQMVGKIIENMGQPFSTDSKDFEDASYIFIEEGKDEERNSIPWEKTARLSIAGTLFNERGAPKYESGKLNSKIDQKEYTNHVSVIGGEDKSIKGVYVRRNVPFIIAAVSTDNGNKRASAGEVEVRIVDANDKEVERDGDAYLFRVPNYPRAEYKDQPDYYFTTSAADKDGNLTTIRMPLYIVNTQAAFEGGRNQ
ncbi:MAG: hypothetical protein CVV42_02905 [Candidatus Riflebacteria bacterium HGW-Riflebacteria-2]|jgi:hypothetical protein|nr:MAG: hypothetical protein CVV42_02905 [Candidatus Riflebacteria bacterium HGW-Riflebacteria-2]